MIQTRKNKVASFQDLITAEYSPATVEDLDWSARWFLTLQNEIASVRKVRVTRQWVGIKSITDAEWRSVSSHEPLHSDGYEISFKCGACGWVRCDGHQELDALVIGTEGYIHGLAVWKKHGWTVGAPVFWFEAQQGKRKPLSASRTRKSCAAELYARAAGKGWG